MSLLGQWGICQGHSHGYYGLMLVGRKNLKASPKLTSAEIDAAYEALKYQYAGFDK